jgi:hypothetical protein
MGYGLWVNLIQRAEPHLDVVGVEVEVLERPKTKHRDVAPQVVYLKGNILNRFFPLDRL